MQFNITALDPIAVLQTAYFHAAPVGYGLEQHQQLLIKGKAAANWLCEKECKELLHRKRNDFDIDYYHGRPLKLQWKKNENGQILLDSSVYDLYQGRFRFLEALVFMFDHSDIMITKIDRVNANRESPIDVKSRASAPEMERLMSHLIIGEDENGKYWKIDTKALADVPELMAEGHLFE